MIYQNNYEKRNNFIDIFFMELKTNIKDKKWEKNSDLAGLGNGHLVCKRFVNQLLEHLVRLRQSLVLREK